MTGGGEGRVRVGEQDKGARGGNLFLNQRMNLMEFILGNVGVVGCGGGPEPGWCPAPIAVTIAGYFHLARSVCPTDGPSTRSASPLPPTFPDFPQAFTTISLWWRWDVALCPTIAGRSPRPRNVPQLRGEPTGISSPPLSLCSSCYPSLYFLFLP